MNAEWVLVVALLLSMYYSGMETAYTAFDRILSVGWLRAHAFGARVVHILSSQPERFLSTTLIGNNIANVVYSSVLVTIAAAAGIGDIWLMTVSPLIVLVIAEILPKTIGYAFANRVVKWNSHLLFASYYLFWPLRMLLLPLVRVLGPQQKPVGGLIAREPLAVRKELDHILVGAEAEGAVSPEESEILIRYLDARELKVRQIMTPRTELVAVSVDASPADVRDIFRRTRYNILPVYRGDLDHIIGFVSARQFLAECESVAAAVKPLHAVPESKRIVDLLHEFRTEHRQLALVIDEYGGTDGLVTLKDIFEELVGPVAERIDPDEPVIKQIAPGKFLVSGSALLEDLEHVCGWDIPETDANTLSGLLTETLGRIANAGEEIEINRVVFRVLRRSPRRIEACLVKVPGLREQRTA